MAVLADIGQDPLRQSYKDQALHEAPRLVVRPDGGRCCSGEHIATLSLREREVFFHMVTGKTMREGAAAMRISKKTIEKHRSRVLRKIGARNAVEAVHFAVIHGLLGLELRSPHATPVKLADVLDFSGGMIQACEFPKW